MQSVKNRTLLMSMRETNVLAWLKSECAASYAEPSRRILGARSVRLLSLPSYMWTRRPLLLLFILGMATSRLGPIGPTLVLVLGTARILDFLKRRLLRAREDRRPSLIAMAIGFAAGGLSRAALYVSLG